VTYFAQLNSWLALQPDLQYVIHPNTDPQLRDAVVVHLRFEVTF
jgi:porin